MKLILFLFLFLAFIFYAALEWKVVLLSVLIMQAPIWLVLIVNAERINLFSANKLGLWCAARGNALSLAGALLVPGRVTELLKPAYYNNQKSLPLAEGISIILLERVFDVFALGGLMLVAVMIVPSGVSMDISHALIIWVVALVIFLSLLIAFCPNVARYLIMKTTWGRVNSWLLSSYGHFQKGLAIGFSPWQLILTVVVWIGSWFAYWVFLQFDGGVGLDFSEALFIFLVGTVGLTVTVTPGGLGTFEALVASSLVYLGYEWEHALVTAFGLRIGAIIPNVILVVYVVMYEGFDILNSVRSHFHANKPSKPE